jgi:opacity protein-like surface antigen
LGATVKKLILLIGSSFLVSTGSMAADLPVKAPPKAAWVDSWAGPYIGAYFAAGAGHATESFTTSITNINTFFANGVLTQTQATNATRVGNMAGNVTGSMVDLFAGYNWQSGKFVVGGQVEGTLFSDVGLKTIGTQVTNSVLTLNGVVNTTTSGFNSVENQQQLRSRAGLIGRAGFLATPDVLLYGLAGLELGHFVYPDRDDAFGGSNGKWVAGYTVGAGAEVRLDDHWSLRGEYRYLNFDVNRNEADGQSQAQAQPAARSVQNLFNSNATARQIRADLNLGKIGLVYRFGETGPISAMAAIPPAKGSAWGDGWAGPYIGAYFGAGAGRAREAFTTTGTSGANPPPSQTTQSFAGNLAGDVTGSMVDLFAGYNWRAGNFVVSGQVEGTLFSDVGLKTIGTSTSNSVSTTNGVVSSTSSGFVTVENEQQLRSRVGLIGRVGFLATPDVLLYGLGGLELGHFVYPDSEDRFGGSNGKWVAGYTVGAGGEVRLTDHWSLRGEYRYLNFDVNRNEADSNAQTRIQGGVTTITTGSDAAARQIRADFHLGQIGLVYRFGETGPISAMAAIPPPIASAWSDGWAGPYMGAYFGAGAGHATQSRTGTSNTSSRDTIVDISTESSVGHQAGDVTGSTVDLFAGYNWRAGNLVVGGQVEGTVFSDVGLKTIGTETFSFRATRDGLPNGTTTNVSTSETNQQLRSRAGLIGRIGFLATPDVLLYSLGGLELGHFVFPDDSDSFGGKNGKWVAGYTVGAGGEVRLAGHWSLRAEYRYRHFDLNRDGAGADGTTQVQGGLTSVTADSLTLSRQTKTDFHLGQVGLVYRFGLGPTTAMASMPVKAVARTACCDGWAGVHAGAYFGSGKGRAKEAFASADTFVGITNPGNQVVTDSSSRAGNFTGDTTGSMVDLFAGYNWRAGRFVVGGQVEGTVFSDVTLKTIGNVQQTSLTNFAGTIVTLNGTRTNEDRQQLRSMAGLIGRAGYLAMPKLLLYGLGGLELGHFVYPDSDDHTGGSNGKWVAGFTAGAGGEYKLTDNWSLRGEYRYVHFNVNRDEASINQSNAVTALGGTSTQSSTGVVTRRIAADIHLGKIGVAYSFCYCGD